jgi:hypothetical protein
VCAIERYRGRVVCLCVCTCVLRYVCMCVYVLFLCVDNLCLCVDNLFLCVCVSVVGLGCDIHKSLGLLAIRMHI